MATPGMGAVRALLAGLTDSRLFEDVVELDDREPLGSGRFGRVVSGVWKPTGERVAIKVPVSADFSKMGPAEVAIVNEVAVMQMVADCGAPNLVPLVAAFREPAPPSVCRVLGWAERQSRVLLMLVMPLASGGDLFSRIADTRTQYNERVAARLFRDVLLGLRALHRLDLVHRDLKPENLLLADTEDESRVIIGDFGLACPPHSTEPRFVGTAPYGAPESHGPGHEYSEASDVWAAGCVLYAMLSGIPPFYCHGVGSAQEQTQAMVRSIRGAAYRFWDAYWSDVSDEAQDLVAGLLRRRPEDRLTVDEALDHPWLRLASSNSTSSLASTQASLRALNARRRFRAAVVATMWATGNDGRLRRRVAKTAAEASLTGEAASRILAALQRRAPTGTVEEAAFVEVLGELGIAAPAAERLFRRFDARPRGSGTGRVSVEVLVQGLATLRGGGEDALRLIFECWDVDGDGQITLEELGRIILIASGPGPGGPGRGAGGRRRRPRAAAGAPDDGAWVRGVTGSGDAPPAASGFGSPATTSGGMEGGSGASSSSSSLSIPKADFGGGDMPPPVPSPRVATHSGVLGGLSGRTARAEPNASWADGVSADGGPGAATGRYPVAWAEAARPCDDDDDDDDDSGKEDEGPSGDEGYRTAPGAPAATALGMLASKAEARRALPSARATALSTGERPPAIAAWRSAAGGGASSSVGSLRSDAGGAAAGARSPAVAGVSRDASVRLLTANPSDPASAVPAERPSVAARERVMMTFHAGRELRRAQDTDGAAGEAPWAAEDAAPLLAPMLRAPSAPVRHHQGRLAGAEDAMLPHRDGVQAPDAPPSALVRRTDTEAEWLVAKAVARERVGGGVHLRDRPLEPSSTPRARSRAASGAVMAFDEGCGDDAAAAPGAAGITGVVEPARDPASSLDSVASDASSLAMGPPAHGEEHRAPRRRRRRPSLAILASATEEERAGHLRDLFASIDVNQDGTIVFEEFRAAVRIHPCLVEAFVRPLDAIGGSYHQWLLDMHA